MNRPASMKPKELLALLLKKGFVEHHQHGSHKYLWNAGTQRMATIPMHSRELKRGTLAAILKQAGITREG